MYFEFLALSYLEIELANLRNPTMHMYKVQVDRVPSSRAVEQVAKSMLNFYYLLRNQTSQLLINDDST